MLWRHRGSGKAGWMIMIGVLETVTNIVKLQSIVQNKAGCTSINFINHISITKIQIHFRVEIISLALFSSSLISPMLN